MVKLTFFFFYSNRGVTAFSLAQGVKILLKIHQARNRISKIYDKSFFFILVNTSLLNSISYLVGNVLYRNSQREFPSYKIEPNTPENHTKKKKKVFTSPAARGVAPIALLRAVISEVGPAIREVPVSAMAWQPPLQNEESPPTDTLKKITTE